MHMPVLELSAEHTVWLTRMENYLKAERYSRNGKERVSMARRFLDYLQKNGLNVHTVQLSDVTKYLSRVKRLRRSHRRTDLSDGQRHMHGTALQMVLRLVHGKWP